MATFRGAAHLTLMDDTVWAEAKPAEHGKGYVVEVDDADADRFRAIAADYGYVEDGQDDAGDDETSDDANEDGQDDAGDAPDAAPARGRRGAAKQ